MVGTRIPYSSYGFKSLEDFLRSQACFTLTNVQGQVLVDAKISGKSAHISEMVGRQKTSKKRVYVLVLLSSDKLKLSIHFGVEQMKLNT